MKVKQEAKKKKWLHCIRLRVKDGEDLFRNNILCNVHTVRLKYNAGTYKPKFWFNKIQSRHDGTNNDVHNNCVKRNTDIFDNPVYHVPKEIIT